MLLGILSVIALTVGTVQTVSDLSEAERIASVNSGPAVVQVVEQPAALDDTADSL